MEPISKKDKVDKIAEIFKTRVLAILDDVKAKTYEYIDQNPDKEANLSISEIEKFLQKAAEPFKQKALQFLFEKEVSEKFFAPQKIEKRALFLGLDACGKTTALYVLKLGEIINTIPTIGFNVETIETKRINLNAWDVGGGSKIQLLWRHYFPGTHVVFYFVDGSNYPKITESAEKFRSLLQEEELRDTIFVIFATRADHSDFDLERVKNEFGLATMSRPHQIYGVNLLAPEFRDTFNEAMSWLEEQWGIYEKQD